jgi:hypothetical protein
MKAFITILLIASSVTAFHIQSNYRVITTTKFHMFTPGPDDAPSPLQVVAEDENTSVIPDEQITDPVPAKKMIIKNLARGGEVKEGTYGETGMIC